MSLVAYLWMMCTLHRENYLRSILFWPIEFCIKKTFHIDNLIQCLLQLNRHDRTVKSWHVYHGQSTLLQWPHRPTEEVPTGKQADEHFIPSQDLETGHKNKLEKCCKLVWWLHALFHHWMILNVLYLLVMECMTWWYILLYIIVCALYSLLLYSSTHIDYYFICMKVSTIASKHIPLIFRIRYYQCTFIIGASL